MFVVLLLTSYCVVIIRVCVSEQLQSRPLRRCHSSPWQRQQSNKKRALLWCHSCQPIGLYRDVWIAAIASSRKSLATQTAAICVRFQGRRVRHEYVTMRITFLTRKSALIYRRGLRQRVASLTLDCNGVFAIKAYYEGPLRAGRG